MSQTSNQYYKVARTNGWDHHTGKTINYRQHIGKTVKCPGPARKNYECCSEHVIHASQNVLDALFYHKFPCSIFVVQGTPVIYTDDKSGFRSFKVIREIDTSNWKIAFAKTMIYILKDVKQCYNTQKFKRVTNTINKIISIMQNIVNTGNFNKQSVVDAAAEAVGAAGAAARAAADVAEWSAVRAAETADVATMVAADAAGAGAAKAAGAARAAARVAAEATWSAAEAVTKERDKKFKEYGEKFVEYLQENEN